MRDICERPSGRIHLHILAAPGENTSPTFQVLRAAERSALSDYGARLCPLLACVRIRVRVRTRLKEWVHLNAYEVGRSTLRTLGLLLQPLILRLLRRCSKTIRLWLFHAGNYLVDGCIEPAVLDEFVVWREHKRRLFILFEQLGEQLQVALDLALVQPTTKTLTKKLKTLFLNERLCDVDGRCNFCLYY